MENEIVIEHKQKTPQIKSKQCRIIAWVLLYILRYATPFSFVVGWYIYDLFIASALTLFVFLIIGIIRATLRNNAIPFGQREYTYSDKEIAWWYTAKQCY